MKRRKEAQREAEQRKVEATRRQTLRDIEKRCKLAKKEARVADPHSKELF